MARQLEIAFHGAARTVTGSCMELVLGDTRVLVDCGLFQGSRSLEALNHQGFAFDARQIAAVVLTHAHIDHCGMLPRLVADGFTGPIYCTRPTADLLEFMLADAGRIQEYEAEKHNRRRDRAGEARFEPLYTEADALLAAAQAHIVDLGQWFEPAPGFRARLWNAGHILGSASAEIEADGTRMLFSGDIGPDQKAFHPDPDAPAGFDYVVCESTYGDRAREKLTLEQRRGVLEKEVVEAIARGGNLVIPAFALERTQELLLDLVHLLDSGRIPRVQVFVDSPLANKATRVFAKHAGDLEDTGGVNVFDHPSIHHVDEATVSMRLNTVSGAIIIAASGMCEAGRIRHHLRHNLHRRDSTVLFVGFQAQGSLGRVIMEGAERVRISGEDINVRAQIRRIDSYSAHADQCELATWIAERLPVNGSLFLDHGEPQAVAALADLVRQDNKALSIVMPELGEAYALAPGAPARRTRTARAEAAACTGCDWQNDYAEFALGLKRELAQIRDEHARRKAIAEMRKVLEGFSGYREKNKARNRHRRPGSLRADT